MTERRRGFLAAVFAGGLLFGFGLAYSHMTHPEVVLDFLQIEDLGLAFVMGGGILVLGVTIGILSRTGWRAPLSGDVYGRRLRSLDRNVLVGGGIFGVGWGLSGICPGAAYASFGIGNYPILYGVAGMLVGAYLQGYWRQLRTDRRSPAVSAGD